MNTQQHHRRDVGPNGLIAYRAGMTRAVRSSAVATRSRAISASLAGIVLAAAGWGTVTAGSTPPASSEPLRILLTNDDGWDAEGITAVFEALTAAGHDVVIVAPAENQSGTGASFNNVGPFTVTRHAENVYAVTGTPADATELGLDIAFPGARPDLVVSGTNEGQNIAGVTVHSGTVGAAVTALNDGVPAIAVSTELDFVTGIGSHTDAASFTAGLIDTLSATAGDGPILPEGVGLNVNFPMTDGTEPSGVVVRATDRTFLDVTYDPANIGGPGIGLPEVGASLDIAGGLAFPEPINPQGDAASLAADFVTVTFITGNYDAITDLDPTALTPFAEAILAMTW